MKTKEFLPLEEGVRRNLQRLTTPGQRILLAVSGGPDSVALLAAAVRVGGRSFEAATVDHALRPESGEEARAVARLAATLGLPHHAVPAPIGGGPGVEAAAREARYRALEQLRSARGLHLVATAHTASDQAETLLMRLARGAALAGASGILARREDRVIRPLLFATRAEVEAYVAARGLEVSRDPMNDDPAFLRVRVRGQVMPALAAAAGPSAERALARFAAFAAEDEAWLSEEAERAARLALTPDGETLAAEPLAALGPPIARRVLTRWLVARGVEVDGALIEDVLRAVRDRGTSTLPGDRVLSCSNGRVQLLPSPARLHATSS